MRRYTKYLVTALMLAVLVATGVGCGSPETTVQYQPVEVYRGNLVVSVSSDGNVRLDDQREVYFEIPGDIVELLVEKGDAVHQGDVIARLDTEAMGRDLKALELARDLAELNLETAHDGVDLANLDLKTAQSRYQAADNAYQQVIYPYTYQTFAFSMPQAIEAINNSLTELNTLKRALESGDGLTTTDDSGQNTTAADTMDQLITYLEKAREKLTLGKGDAVFGDVISGGALLPYSSIWTLRSLQETREQAALGVDRATVAVTNAERGVKQAEIALENAGINLAKGRDQYDKATLKAPIDGTVTDVYAKVGEQRSSVNYLSLPVVQITDLTTLEVEADVDEIDIPQVKLGQAATLEIDAVPDMEIPGTVSYVSPISMLQAGLVLYRVKIQFTAPEGSGIRPGMTATAKIQINERQNVLIVNDRAIRRGEGGQPEVLVQLPDGTIKARQVTVGVSNGIETEIISGLQETDKVVIEIRTSSDNSGFGF